MGEVRDAAQPLLWSSKRPKKKTESENKRQVAFTVLVAS